MNGTQMNKTIINGHIRNYLVTSDNSFFLSALDFFLKGENVPRRIWKTHRSIPTVV